MPKFPIIPPPEINNRPDSRVGNDVLPSVEGAARPFQELAAGVAEGGDRLAQAQAQRDAATDKLKKVGDEVTATRMAGDHSEKARNILAQVQQENWDTPEKTPDVFRQRLNELTNSEIKNATSPELALDIAKRYASLDDSLLTGAHNWMTGRMAQKAKSDFTQMGQGAVRTAQSASTVQGLAAAISDAEKNLAPVAQKVHGNAAEEMIKLKRDMAVGWVETNGPNNPAAVETALKAGPQGPLGKWLTAKEIDEYSRKLPGMQKRLGEDLRGQLVREGLDQASQVAGAMREGQITSRELFPMRIALQNKSLSIEHNPQLTADEKTAQRKLVNLQLDGLKYVEDIVHQPQTGDGDEKATAKLFKRLDGLSSPTDKTPKDLFEAFTLQHDLFKAEAEGDVSPDRARVLQSGLRLALGSDLAKQPKSSRQAPAAQAASGGRATRWSGTTALDSYLEGGAFGKLTDAQKNQARHDYHEQMTSAARDGRNVDSKAAQQMAFNAVRGVVGRRAPKAGE